MIRTRRFARRSAWSVAWLLAAGGVFAAWQRSRAWCDDVGYTDADGTRYAAVTFPGGLVLCRGPAVNPTDRWSSDGPAPGWHAYRFGRPADGPNASEIAYVLALGGRRDPASYGPPAAPWLDPGGRRPRHGFDGLGWMSPPTPRGPPPAGFSFPNDRPAPPGGLGVPFWLPAGLVVAGPAAALAVRRRRRRTCDRAGRCRACGYDLRASPAPGAPSSAACTRTSGRPPPSPSRRCWAAARCWSAASASRGRRRPAHGASPSPGAADLSLARG